MLSQSIEREYRGFTIAGSAELTANGRFDWFAVGRITVLHPNRVVHEVYKFQDSAVVYDDEDLCKWFGLGIAEIVVDECLPPPSYYLRPMDIGWAVGILRRDNQ